MNGGGGGAGGCGGSHGSGGIQGGASIGIVLDQATLTVNSSSITGGQGGNGGNGGAAKAGGQASNGHAGFTQSGGYSDGGKGGNGGTGGSGGGGAPGNGGPAFNIVLVNGATTTGDPVMITGYGGTAGNQGDTQSTNNNACEPNKGQVGLAGRVSPLQTFNY